MLELSLELEVSKSVSPTEQQLYTDENQPPNFKSFQPTFSTPSTSPIETESTVINNQNQNTQIKMEEESTTEDTLQPEVINKQEDGYLVAVAGSLEGRSSRATDADDSSLGNIGEEEEEDSEGDYIELPALTKPCSHDHPSSSTSQSEEGGVAIAEPSKKFSKENLQLEKKAGKEKKEAAEESSKVRGRSNSLFKILGRRQKLVEEAEQKKDDEKLDEGEVWVF